MVNKAVGSTLAFLHQPTKKIPPVAERRRRRRGLKRKAIDYLFSDDYMFAPFLSSSSSVSSSSSIRIDEEEAGGKAKEEKKDFVKKVGEYLKSDCYLYTPLLITQPWLTSSPLPTQTGLHELLKKKKAEDLSSKEDGRETDDDCDNRRAVEKVAISVVDKEDQSCANGGVRKETVKHVVFQRYHHPLPPAVTAGKTRFKKKGGGME